MARNQEPNEAWQQIRAMLTEEKKKLSPKEFRRYVSGLVEKGKRGGGHILWSSIEDEFCPETEWCKDWPRGSWEGDLGAVRWLRRQSPIIKSLAVRFPPSCIVRATKTVVCPSPGNVAIVTRYLEANEDDPEGLVGVRSNPEGLHTYDHRPEILEVVGYHQGLTQEAVAALLVEEK